VPTDPERYLNAEELQRELPFGPYDLQIDDETTDAAGNTDWDNLLLDVLGRESDRVDEWASTTFVTETSTEELARPEHVPRRDLPLPARPIHSVATISVDDEGELTQGDDFAVEPTHLVLLEDADISAWPTDYRSIEAEWTHGHDAVPGEVADALVRLCRNAIERIKTDGLESESTGDGASYSYRLPSDVKAEAASAIGAHEAPSYYGGAAVI